MPHYATKHKNMQIYKKNTNHPYYTQNTLLNGNITTLNGKITSLLIHKKHLK